MIELADYQQEAVEFLLNKRRAILGDHPGVGKSFPALEACDSMPPPRLVVVPAYLAYQWRDYIKEYLGPDELVSVVDGTPKQRNNALDRKADWTIVSYNMVGAVEKKRVKGHLLKTGKHRYPQIHDRVWQSVICDEVHRAKGRNSQWTQQLYKLHAYYMFLLTGTPIVKDAGDLFPLLRLCDPQTFTSYWKFVGQWCTVTENPWQKVVGAVKDPEAFDTLVRKYMLRRSLEDVGIDLGAPIERIVRVRMLPSILKAHREAKASYLLNHPDMSRPEAVINGGALVTKLRQFVGCPPTKENPKANAVLGILNDRPHEPVIVLSWYKASRDELSRRITKAFRGVRPIFTIQDEDYQKDRRTKVVEDWKQTGNGILIATEGCIKEGMNLQNAAVIILYEADWVEATNTQVIARCRRRGQTRAVHVYRIIGAGTIDSYVHRVSQKRHENALRALLEELVGG